MTPARSETRNLARFRRGKLTLAILLALGGGTLSLPAAASAGPVVKKGDTFLPVEHVKPAPAVVKGIEAPFGTRAGIEATELGPGANAAGYRAMAIGYDARALQDYSMALGPQSRSIGLTTAIGRNAYSQETGALAIGGSSRTVGMGGVAIGQGGNAGEHGVVIGGYSSAIPRKSMAIGFQVHTSEENEVVIGRFHHNTRIPGTLTVEGSSLSVGAANPSERLDVDGRLKLWDTTHPSDLPTSGIVFYSYMGTPQLATPGGVLRSLSNDLDPRLVAPKANSSFANPKVDIPFSLSQSNAYLGKGAILDLSKAMAWVETQMQNEMGVEEGRVVYSFDLPKEYKRSTQEHAAIAMADAIESELQRNPWKRVEFVNGNRLPAEAVQKVEVTKWVEVTEKVTEYQVDWSTNAVVPVVVEKVTPKEVGTGQFEMQLKPNYKLENGQLYRQRTIDDIDFSTLDVPELPSWIRTRMNAQTAETIGDRITAPKN